jgi:trk system potassium uptake protein TrkA
MKIIIVGDGKVGYTLSDNLSREGHDITIIDNRNDVLQRSLESLDVFTIKGNGTSASVLKQAGVAKADLLIAATSMDEVNILCCLMGRKLGAERTIARIRNPEYREQLNMFEKEMGLSMAVNPEFASAKEIARLVSFPSAMSVGTFADDRVFMAEFRIEEDNLLAGKPVSSLHDMKMDILIGVVDRQHEAFIPNGDFVLNRGDHIHVVGDYANIENYLKLAGHYEKKIRSVMIVGGSLIAYYLSNMLLDLGIDVKIIERDQDRCEHLSEILPSAMIISGDGTDKELLDSEGLTDYSAFVALTNMDEENLIISLYAAYKGVPKVITKINRLGYADVISNAGINRVISPKNIAANQIIRYVRNMENTKGNRIKTLYRVVGNSAEVVEFSASASTKNLGVPFSRLPIKNDVLIATIVRNNEIIIPKGKDYIVEGDSVVVVTTIEHLNDLNDIFI